MRFDVDNVFTRVSEANDEEIAFLYEYLTFVDEQAHFTGAFLRKKRPGAKIDTSMHLFQPRMSQFPTGLLQTVIEGISENDFPPPYLVDRRHQPGYIDQDADLAWLRPDQLLAVCELVEASRGLAWMGTGCLTGDTKLTINRSGGAGVLELRTVVSRMQGKTTRNRNGRLCSWDLSIPTYTQSVDDDGFVRRNEIVAVHENGRKRVWEILTSTGRMITATVEHRFRRMGVWVRLRNLRVGDDIDVVTWAPKDNALLRRKSHDRMIRGMWNHPHNIITSTGPSKRYAQVAFHRLVAEARENDLSVAEFVGRIVLNDLTGLHFIDPEKWHVHHKDHNHDNNEEDNLVVLSPKEHIAQHGREGGWKHVAGRSITEKIVSITDAGEQEVYDLTMADPHHNYVANGFVVHNSGKTEIQFGIVRMVPIHWLMVVHQVDLATQTAKRWVEERGGNPPGMIGGLKKKNAVHTPDPGRRFTIATFATLYRGFKDGAKWALDLLADVEGILVDETHVAAANSHYAVLMACRRAFYRLGFSATPLQRTDRKSIFTVAALGNVVHTVRAHELIDKGVLSKPFVRMIKVKQDVDHDAAVTYKGLYGMVVVRSRKRNAAVLYAVEHAQKPCWVFVKELAQGKMLEQEIRRLGFATEFVFGKSKKREDAVRRNTHGDTDVLVCSVVFQAGIDMPTLAAVINAAGGKSVIAALQKAGRGMRLAPGKDTFEVWDIYDEGVRLPEPELIGYEKGKPHPITRHAKKRAQAYLQEKYETVLLDLETGKESKIKTRGGARKKKEGDLF